MSYSFNSYEVLVTGNVTTTNDVTLGRETTSLAGDRDHLTIASYNVENLDLGDGTAKFNMLAHNIVYNLAAPDIIGLQEVQDADGPGATAPNLSGVVTAQALIDAIAAIGGPHYVYIEIAPTADGLDRRRARRQYPQRLSLQHRPGHLCRRAAPQLIEDAAYQRQPQSAGRRLRLQRPDRRPDQRPLLSRGRQRSRFGAPTSRRATPATPRAPPMAEAVARLCQQRVSRPIRPALRRARRLQRLLFRGARCSIAAPAAADRPPPAQCRPRSAIPTCSTAISRRSTTMIVTGGLLTRRAVSTSSTSTPSSTTASRPTDHDPQRRPLLHRASERGADRSRARPCIGRRERAGGHAGRHVSADDPDGDTLSYTLIDDAGGRFASIALDRRADHHRRVRLRGDCQASAIIASRHRPRRPSASTEPSRSRSATSTRRRPTSRLDHASVDENAPAGTLVGNVSADDPDGDTLTYTLVDNAGGRFAIDAVDRPR